MAQETGAYLSMDNIVLCILLVSTSVKFVLFDYTC